MKKIFLTLLLVSVANVFSHRCAVYDGNNKFLGTYSQGGWFHHCRCTDSNNPFKEECVWSDRD